MILSDLRCAVFHLHSRTKSQIDHSWYLVCTQFQTRVIWVDWQELGFPMAIRYVLEFCPPLHLCYPVDYKPSLHHYQITRLLYWLLNQFRLYSSSHSSSDWLLWQRVPGTLRGNDNKSRIISIIQHYEELNHWIVQFYSSDWLSRIWAIIPCSPNMVTIRVCSNSKQAENRLFLEIKSGRVLDIFWGRF